MCYDEWIQWRSQDFTAGYSACIKNFDANVLVCSPCLKQQARGRSRTVAIAASRAAGGAFYLCTIIKNQNDLCAIEILKSSSLPSHEISFPYVPLPSLYRLILTELGVN
jgi:hypothetical protein